MIRVMSATAIPISENVCILCIAIHYSVQRDQKSGIFTAAAASYDDVRLW